MSSKKKGADSTQFDQRGDLRISFVQFVLTTRSILKSGDHSGGILAADRGRQHQKDHDLPYKMLVDFVVAGRDIILRDEPFQRIINHDDVPAGFIKEVMLKQYRDECQTAWMETLMVKPMALLNKPIRCILCRRGLNTDEGAHYNPWSHDPPMFVYTQVCCSSCAHSEDYKDEDGMFLGVSSRGTMMGLNLD
ncbi:hypothetical protein VP1G_03778 [Cytospora mali]|uniref:Uncharacterized protein n=1 Tax=Cytospora mali TaxID=578113 RepID=A0A194UXK8_CYTMA|nr:hypothetical protein VP1G_03778 [Valsa mali var. pyri (nom. inval.)]